MKDVRKLLSDALLEICERKSLDHVTVTEIAAHAGLTRQVFYRYFLDKYDLAKFIHICDFMVHWTQSYQTKTVTQMYGSRSATLGLM